MVVVAAIPYRGDPCGGFWRPVREGYYKDCDDPARAGSVRAGRWTVNVYSLTARPRGGTATVTTYVLAKSTVADGWEVVDRQSISSYP